MVKVDVDNGYGTDTIKMWPIRAREIVEAIDQFQLGDSEAIARVISNNIIRVH